MSLAKFLIGAGAIAAAVVVLHALRPLPLPFCGVEFTWGEEVERRPRRGWRRKGART